MKDGEGLIRAEDTQNFDEHPVELWANDENSVGEVRSSDFVLSNEVSDGVGNVASSCPMFES